MNIIAIADENHLVGHLHRPEVDVLISCGDLHEATLSRAAELYRPRRAFAVRGNHDTDGPLPDGFVDLHGRIESFGGLTFGGFGGSWRYKPRGHHLYSPEEVALVMDTFPRVDVFVAHNSPAGIHERDQHTHCGFEAFNRYIGRAAPRCFLHGHQHVESVTLLGATAVLGVFGEKRIHLH